MEPMMIGSAPSSPVTNPTFLPGFLIGETNVNSPSASTSPGRQKSSGSFRMNATNSNDPMTLRQKLFNQSINESPLAPSPFSPIAEKSGPPKLGLFDTLDHMKTRSPVMSSTVAPHSNEHMYFNESTSRIPADDSLNYSRNVQDTMSRVHNSVGQRIDTYWVTVFGFPPSAITLVLSQLSNCGVIVDKKIPSQGNWAHVRFNNYNEVARALSLNGKIISGTIMIGVQPHYVKENKENDSSVCVTPVRARSLRHSFVSPTSPNSVISPVAVPQKSTGLVTKAMEYVFGW